MKEDLVIKENICMSCDHLAVCALRSQFMSCYQALNTCTVSMPNGENEFLKDIEFISVDLTCTHYSDRTKPIFR